MPADKGHEAGVIKMIHAGLLFPPVRSLIGLLTVVDSFVRDYRLIGFAAPATRTLNSDSHTIHECFGQHKVGIVKERAISSGPLVAMVKVAIDGDVEIGSAAKS
jgi:hypothetical protein